MRLIDADELPCKEMVDGMLDVFDILEAPTIEAIPIEWLMEIIRLAKNTGHRRYAEHLQILLEDWRKENEG